MGDVAKYTCPLDMVLNGSDTRVCTSNGTWSLADPTCIGKYVDYVARANLQHHSSP